MASELREPIVVTGPLRSGVRLLAAVLDRHPDLASGPELPFFHTIVRQARDIEANLGTNLARHHGLPPPTMRRLFRGALAELVAARFARVGADRFVLHSFAAGLALEDYAVVLPDARFVVVVRDPRAVAVSLRGCDWRDPRTGTPLPYTQSPLAAARHWRDTIACMYAPLQRLESEGRLIILRYEALCRAPDITFSKLARFLGIRAGLPHVAPDSAARVTAALDNIHPPLRQGPLTAGRVDAWQTAMSSAQIAQVESITAEGRRLFQYEDSVTTVPVPGAAYSYTPARPSASSLASEVRRPPLR